MFRSFLSPIVLFIIEIGFISISLPPALAQCNVGNGIPLSAVDSRANNLSGSAVAIDNVTALIGAPRSGYSFGAGPGEAYLWHYDGAAWTPQQTLLASDGFSGDRFGYGVALSGDWAIVTAPERNGGVGVSYVFHTDPVQGWIETQRLFPSLPSYGFGVAVAMSGNVAVIGSYGDESGAGSAYVFRLAGLSWVEEQRLLSTTPGDADLFGAAVAIFDNSIIVGAPGDNERGADAGAAFVYRFDGAHWNFEQKVTAADGASGDALGSAVAIYNNQLASSAIRNDDQGPDSGSVYIFRFGDMTWSQSQKLVAADGQANDWFGTSVAISADSVVVGTPGADSDILHTNTGAAYRFYADPSGTLLLAGQKLLPPSSNSDDNFGNAVSLSGDAILIGAYLASPVFSNSGEAFVFPVGCSPVISNSDPPNGYVDPLEDRDATSGALFGIQNVAISFSSPVIDAQRGFLTISNFQIRYVRNSLQLTAAEADLQTHTAPTVTLLSGNGRGPYLLHFSPRLPLGTWTEIKAVNVTDDQGHALSTINGNDRIVLGNLPMDITQDGKVLDNDINRWLQIKNNIYDPAPLTKFYYCDQKRNGIIAGEDIPRAIQLISGTGTFRAWKNFDIGPKP